MWMNQQENNLHYTISARHIYPLKKNIHAVKPQRAQNEQFQKKRLFSLWPIVSCMKQFLCLIFAHIITQIICKQKLHTDSKFYLPTPTFQWQIFRKSIKTYLDIYFVFPLEQKHWMGLTLCNKRTKPFGICNACIF